MHCRGHPGGEKLDRVAGSWLYKIISYPNWKIAGEEFRKHDDFGVKITNAGEFLPSAKWIEIWRKENRPEYIYETSLPQSFGASEKIRPLDDNQKVLDEIMKKHSSKYEEWYLRIIYFLFKLKLFKVVEVFLTLDF